MERIKVLEWKRISLVVPEKQDIDIWYRWMNKIDIAKNLLNTFGNVWYREDEEEFYENQRKNKNNVMYSIYLNNEKKTIWNIGLNSIDKLSRRTEMWIAIFEEEYLSKWYWSEAIKLILKYAFEIIWLHKVFLRYVSFNKRWEKAYEKVWFKKCWVLKEHSYIMWKYYDEVYMEIFKKDFIK